MKKPMPPKPSMGKSMEHGKSKPAAPVMAAPKPSLKGFAHPVADPFRAKN